MPGTQAGDGDGAREVEVEREAELESDGNREADAVTLKPRVGDTDDDGARDAERDAEHVGVGEESHAFSNDTFAICPPVRFTTGPTTVR